MAKEVMSATFWAELALRANSYITTVFSPSDLEASNTPDGQLGPGMRTSHRIVPNQPKVIIWKEQARRKLLLCQTTERMGCLLLWQNRSDSD